ncbi:hypothetical protein CBR_g25789 [Chara braunii]|uniref:Uncharacterized protein n=1 Tax=Chara braunii TaxID=69332 RepID=A0A388L6F6_CHABU|nr:hypothetical protein CBR_g25789 [Chara braunii]|eukprot:GBG77858.1 hypothetical protein CBR_g25789 [Chara braunii]
MAEPLTFGNYKAQFDEEDPFDAEDMQEMSDSETFDFESMPLPWVVAQVDDEGEDVPRRYSTSPASLKCVFERETVEDQSSDDGEEEKDYDYEPGDNLPRDHYTWENDRLFFYGKHHRFTPEDVWGHNVMWHVRKFQLAVKTGKWVMAMKEADGKWSGMNRLGAGPFKKKAREALVEHLSIMNPDRSLPDVNAYEGQKLDELYANKMLEPSEYERYASEGASIDFQSKSAADPGEEELSQDVHAVHWEEETQHWPPRRVLDGLNAGVLETGASWHLRHPSEACDASVQGPFVGVLETEASECEGHALEETHVVQWDEELLEGSSGNAINIGDTDSVSHSASPLTMQEGDGNGGYGMFVEGKDRGREGRAWTFGEGRFCGDQEGKEKRVLETQLNDDEEGEGAVGEAQLFSGDVSARLHDDEAGEETVGEAQSYAGEVSGRLHAYEVSGRLHAGEVSAHIIGSKRADHDSTSTSYGEEQGDRAPALCSGREMVLHEATKLVSDSTAIELVSDSAVVEMQNIESSTDVGTVA